MVFWDVLDLVKYNVMQINLLQFLPRFVAVATSHF